MPGPWMSYGASTRRSLIALIRDRDTVVGADGVDSRDAEILAPGDEQQRRATDQAEPLETVEALAAQVQRAADGVHEGAPRPRLGERRYGLRDLVHLGSRDAGYGAHHAV